MRHCPATFLAAVNSAPNTTLGTFVLRPVQKLDSLCSWPIQDFQSAEAGTCNNQRWAYHFRMTSRDCDVLSVHRKSGASTSFRPRGPDSPLSRVCVLSSQCDQSTRQYPIVGACDSATTDTSGWTTASVACSEGALATRSLESLLSSSLGAALVWHKQPSGHNLLKPLSTTWILASPNLRGLELDCCLPKAS